MKVGVASDPEQRLRTLDAASPVEIRLIRAIRWHNTDRIIHRALEAHRVRGEWFAPHPDVMRAANSLESLHSHDRAAIQRVISGAA